MRREPHVRFGERAAVKFHRATHLMLILADGTPMKIPGVYLTLLQQTKPSP